MSFQIRDLAHRHRHIRKTGDFRRLYECICVDDCQSGRPEKTKNEKDKIEMVDKTQLRWQCIEMKQNLF